MAVPKKRTGASAQGHRRSNWKATVPETTNCKSCGALVLTHTVCTECGQYKNKVVSRKAEGFVEDAVKAEKPAKKVAAKAPKAKKEAVKAEPKVEEVKAEEAVVEVTEAPVEEKTETEDKAE